MKPLKYGERVVGPKRHETQLAPTRGTVVEFHEMHGKELVEVLWDNGERSTLEESSLKRV